MSLSDTYETTTLNWLFTSGAVTRPTTWFIALYTVAPTDSTAGTEVTGGSYARQAVTMTVTGDTASNSATVEWPEATASWGTVVAAAGVANGEPVRYVIEDGTAWEIVVAAAVMTASTGGTIIAYGALTASKDISSGDVFRFPAGAFDVTLN
jgi:hypothetical protein